jgi:hypothetical protein
LVGAKAVRVFGNAYVGVASAVLYAVDPGVLGNRSQNAWCPLLETDEYSRVAGLITLEDILETLLGLEIADEGDTATDMQQHMGRLWRKRTRQTGLDVEE